MALTEIEKNIAALKEGTTMNERLRSVRWLLEHGGVDGIKQLLEVKKDESDSELAHLIDKFLAEKDILIDLGPHLVDDWFESMVRTIEGFEEVCDLVGYRFVAFAMIAGINMKAVNHNPEFPADSTVEFSIGGDTAVNEMSIEEFRKTLVLSILSPDSDTPAALSAPPSREEITRLLGVRYFLLAPLYALKLKRLFALDASQGFQGYVVEVEKDGKIYEWTIPIFRENLRKLVSREEIKEKEPVGRFTQESIALAEKALEAGNPANALEHLRDWILFVRNYRITGGIAQLLHEPDAHFERGLLLTGRAYRLLKRNRISEDILRFSIQLLPTARKKPVFLYELALIMVSEGRFGEAIGPLRKAQRLGIPRSLVFPHLGRAFLECNRSVAAFLVLGELNREGLLDDDSRRWYEDARRRLGDIVDIIAEIPSPEPDDTASSPVH
jgi:tetratricopeptide (TPR) repeat protein